jgi:hypothetical protein
MYYISEIFNIYVRFRVLMAATLKMTAFWEKTL